MLTKLIKALVILFLLFGSSISKAQNNNVSFGFISGLNFATFDEGRYNNHDFFLPGTGYILGITYDLSLKDNIELNLEAQFSKMKIREKFLVEEGPIYNYEISDFSINKTSFSIPVTINYNVERLGLQFGIYNNISIDQSSEGVNLNEELNNLDFNTAFDYGLVLGGHYDFYNLEIGMRKYFGMKNHHKMTISNGHSIEEISLYKLSMLQFFVKYHL